MIELLLQAERSLAMGLVDQAERLYRQAADADPRNSIAVVGLARVALERADDAEAWRQAQRALVIDPENAAARRLVERLEEVFAHRGQPLPEPATGDAPELVAGGMPEPVAGGMPEPVAGGVPEPEPAAADVEPADKAATKVADVAAAVAPDPRPAAAVPSGPRPAAPVPSGPRPAVPRAPATPSTTSSRRGLVDRLLGRKRT